MPIEKKKNVVVGIRMDGHGRELLTWAIVKVAEPGDCVIAVHVCRRSDHVLKEKALLDGYLGLYEGLCNVNKVVLKGQVLTGRSVRKALVTEAKDQAAMVVIVGISKLSGSRGWASRARFCSKRLPLTTDVLGIRNGIIVFRRFSNNRQPGLEGNPRRSFYLLGKSTFRESQSEYGDYSEAETEKSSSQFVQTSEDCSRYSFESKDELLSVVHSHNKLSTRSVSLLIEDLKEKRPGWPLLRRESSLSPKGLHTRNTSVVQWVLSLPNRFPQHSPRCSSPTENQFERQCSDLVDETNKNCLSALSELPKDMELLLKTSSCVHFSYEVLKTATCSFSSDNLIGKGGCNHVYKGILPDGKSVVVKSMKASKEAQKTFASEVDIISYVKHEHITPLLGICIVDNNLLSIYNFLPKGSLEENLHGKNKHKLVLSWEVRFNVAIKIAEALNYLHNECSRPVIHRDVKSSNILLSDELEPQLSDFGLAIWGPTTSSFLTEVDIVGTFGYLAPEYFMYGKVSDKIDVYSFGVVLLELLSGRKPISSETPKGQESLVMWAKPKIHSDDVRSILDPTLDGKFDEGQMQRMVLAATLCITQAARLRPKMSQILNILKDEKAVEKWTNPINGYLGYSEHQDDNDDEVYPDSCAESHLSLALLDVDDDSTSFSSGGKSTNLSLEDYFKERSRSSSFDKL